MSEWMIEVDGVSRKFGRQTVLDGLNLRIKRGSIYGLLGRNGSGKTTLMKIIAGLVHQDSGQVKVMGIDPWKMTAEDRQSIGYLSEKQLVPNTMKIEKLLKFTAQFYPRWDFARVDRLLESFGLDRRKGVMQLSQGEKRQLEFILAAAQRPDLLILDEPSANLDVVVRQQFQEEVLALNREQGTTVLLSTHILSDVERMVDEVGILAKGQIRLQEPLDHLKESIRQVRFYNSSNEVLSFPVPGAYRRQEGRGELVVTLRFSEESAIAARAREHGCQYEVRFMNLEDIFADVSRADGKGGL